MSLSSPTTSESEQEGPELTADYERDEADVDERSFPPASVTRGPTSSGTGDGPKASQPFAFRDDFLIPLEKGQAVNRSWPDAHQNRPRGVTWHWSAGGSLAGLRATIGGKNADRKGEASAHYGVGRSFKEGVDRYVGVENRSWHAGKNQLHRWDGEPLSSDDDKATRTTIGIETVGLGPAGGKIVAQADWISAWAATNAHLLVVQPWTAEQVQLMIAVAQEIQEAWPHLTWRDHHGHEDLCPSYKQDVAGFPFAQVLRAVYGAGVPDLWTPLRTLKARQRVLIALGYDLGRSGADGDWGGKSQAALSAFQRSEGLPQTPYWTTFVAQRAHDVLQSHGRVLEQVAAGTG